MCTDAYVHTHSSADIKECVVKVKLKISLIPQPRRDKQEARLWITLSASKCEICSKMWQHSLIYMVNSKGVKVVSFSTRIPLYFGSLYFPRGGDYCIKTRLCNQTISEKNRQSLPVVSQQDPVILWEIGCKQKKVRELLSTLNLIYWAKSNWCLATRIKFITLVSLTQSLTPI